MCQVRGYENGRLCRLLREAFGGILTLTLTLIVGFLEKLLEELQTQMKGAKASSVLDDFFGHDIVKTKLCEVSR